MKMPTEQEMKAAVAARDQSRDRDFCYGVITTGVCCKPSCPSRPAKSENLRFFPNIEAAVMAGFRPCKRCLATDETSRVAVLTKIARYCSATIRMTGHPNCRRTRASLKQFLRQGLAQSVAFTGKPLAT